LSPDGGDGLIQFLRFSRRRDHPFEFFRQTRIFGMKHNQGPLQFLVADKSFALQTPDTFRFILGHPATIPALHQQAAEQLDILGRQGAQPPHRLFHGLIIVEIGQPTLLIRVLWNLGNIRLVRHALVSPMGPDKRRTLRPRRKNSIMSLFHG